MTPTDELRALLDERGIKWWPSDDPRSEDIITHWCIGPFKWTAIEGEKDLWLNAGITGYDPRSEDIIAHWCVGPFKWTAIEGEKDLWLNAGIAGYEPLAPKQAVTATVGTEPWEPSKEWKAWHESLKHDNPTSVREAVENILYEAIEFGGDMGPNGNVWSGVDEGAVLTKGCIDGWVKSIEEIAATVGARTDLSKRLREVHGLHAFAELFGFSWEDESDWDWHDVACAMADAIDVTAGVVPETKYLMALDEAREAQRKLEMCQTSQKVYQGKCRSLKETNADLRRIIDDMKAATVGTEPDEVTMLKLHDRMNAALLDYESAMGIEGGNGANTVPFVIEMHQIIEDAATVGANDASTLQAKVKAQSDYINKLRGEYKALDEQMERRCAEYRSEIHKLRAELDAATVGVGTCRAVVCNQSDCVHNREYRCACTDLEIQDQECLTYRCRYIDYDEEEE